MNDRHEQLHDDLLRAFNEYYKANFIWLTKGTKRSGIDTRYWLAEIRRLCAERRKAIQEWRYDCGKFAPLTPSKAALDRLKKKNHQNSSEDRDNDDN